ncbi:capping complex subunit for YIEGIA [Anaeropeptidivorans aminofermentans]|uniref:capping complex subunit for YIEGIA n=1 Tax=Anaeropeptidivorans aminofermentans TaxID=2934315 RepID=UPI0020242B97|nr:hypothetical protein [Anaeropeptidivorans aminofermentans]MBE6011069.1 hypothetical protein [Lachnospiraceae bacterium]
MAKDKPEILVYITDNKERIISGDPLTLYIPNEEERRDILRDLGIALHADVVQLKNGDHVLICR